MLELHISLVYHVSYEVIHDLYMLGMIMKYWILGEFDTTMIVIVDHRGIQLLIK